MSGGTALVDRLSRGRLVSITGIDGAGKTTASRQLEARLTDRGVDAEYVYGKYRPMLLYPVMKVSQALFLSKEDAFEDYKAHRQTKQETTGSHPFLARLYVGLFLVDYLLQMWLLIVTRLLLGRTVICDRYVFDTVIIDLAVDFEYSVDDVRNLLNRFSPFYPTPDCIVLLDVPPAVSLERKDDIPDEAFLRDRRTYFHQVLDSTGAVVVDGSADVETVADRVEAAYDDSLT